MSESLWRIPLLLRMQTKLDDLMSDIDALMLLSTGGKAEESAVGV